METRKVEYAPDYKSPKRNEAAIKLLDEWLSQPVVEETPEMKEFRTRINGELDTEHQRLQSAVVEAAKLDRRAETKLPDEGANASFDRLVQTRRAFREAVTALMAFEAERNIK